MHGPLLVIYLKLKIYFERKNNVHSFLNRWIFLNTAGNPTKEQFEAQKLKA